MADTKTRIRYRNAGHARRFAARKLMEQAAEGDVPAARALANLTRQLEVDEARRKHKPPIELLEGRRGEGMVDYLRARIVEVAGDVEAARVAGSHQAVIAALRLEVKLRGQLQVELDREDPLANLTEEQYRDRLAGELRDWPDDYLELAIAEYETRHRVRANWLRVHKGGGA